MSDTQGRPACSYCGQNMTHHHRAEAALYSEPHNAVAHALLAIHDLLAERLLPDGTEAAATAVCDREHDDEWVKVDDWSGLPDGARVRCEWMVGVADGVRRFILRDDLPDKGDE